MNEIKLIMYFYHNNDLPQSKKKVFNLNYAD